MYERSGRDVWGRLVSSLSLAILLVFQACRAVEGDGPVEATPPRALPARVETFNTEPPVQEEAVDLMAAHRRRWQELWISAGGASLPDVPAALATARLEERAAALKLLSMDLKGHLSGPLREMLGATLLDPATPDHVWCAAARACAKLSLHEQANVLALSLDADSASRKVAAREALFILRGVWLEDSAAAEALLGDGTLPSAGLTAVLRETTERLREHAAVSYTLDPEKAVTALDDPDPVLRVSAVRALHGALLSADPESGSDPAQARIALLEHLKREHHPLVLHVLIGGFLEQFGPSEVCTRDGRDFASVLHGRAQTSDETTLAPVVYGLARMPLDPALPRKDEAGIPAACSLAYAAAALVGDPDENGEIGLLIGWLRPGSPMETDALSSALRSLEFFFERPLADNPRAELRAALLDVIEDEERDPEIRAGAVRVVARAGRPEDLPRLGAVLEGAPTSVAYELIATITKLAEGVEATAESALAARDALVGMLSRREASLRRRALAMLATEPLSGLAETTDADLLLAVLEQDLSAEESETLLDLLARREDPALVFALLDHSSFQRLSAPTSGVSAIFTETLGRLASGDGPLTHEVARRLLETPLPTEEGDAAVTEGVQRLRNALALLALLDNDAAQKLSLEQHVDVVRWSIELREAAGTLAGVTTESVPTAFLERLTEIHLVACDPESEREFWAHPTALLNADYFAALELESTDAQWLPITKRTRSYFEYAHDYAKLKTADAGDEWEVLRDLARFLVTMEEPVQALREYRRVVNQESTLGVTAATSILDLADLRRAAQLAAEESPRDPEPTQTAFDLTLTLIEREYWMSEPAGVRLGDLGALVERAKGSEEDIVRLRLLFAGLPDPGFDPADAALPETALWLGLESDPERLKDLLELVESLDAPAPAEEAPQGEPESSSDELGDAQGEDLPPGS